MDMNNGASDNNAEEPSVVNEGAFWHTNMDLYYGFSPGEVVEVEHEPAKYWLASIQYCFKHLVLLKWIGNYGSEFWVDASNQNSSSSSTTNSSGAPSEPHGNPRRIYSLGHHQLPSLRSQFSLEKPKGIFERPSLYDPAKDPYASVRTIDDLLAHQIEETSDEDKYACKSTSDTASQVLAKCKSKINYGQEDRDELMAALSAISGLDREPARPECAQREGQEPIPSTHRTWSQITSSSEASSSSSSSTSSIGSFSVSEFSWPPKGDPGDSDDSPAKGRREEVAEELEGVFQEDEAKREKEQKQLYWQEDQVSLYSDSDFSSSAIEYRKDRFIYGRTYWLDIMKEFERYLDLLAQDKLASKLFKLAELSINVRFSIKIFDTANGESRGRDQDESQQDYAERDKLSLKLCKDILEKAQQGTNYTGVDSSGLKQNEISYPLRPKILYDLGGANHERLLVRGTLLSIWHTCEDALGNLDVHEWIAIVIKNVGGRLTLRWFLCDEPKFKQGRLEMKSCVSRYVSEDIEPQATGNDCSLSDSNNGTSALPSLSDLRSPPHSSGDLISSRALTFSMHFCNPRIKSITDRSGLRLPDHIASHFRRIHGYNAIFDVCHTQVEHVFDPRRMNLDRDRLLIDELFGAVRSRSPSYLGLTFGSDDFQGRREVLMSCPKMTKLIRATIQREVEHGVFEVHSEPLNDTEEVIKFIYPYDSSYTVLPLEWSNSNSDCLSVHPSRNPSPTPAPSEDKADNGDGGGDQESNRTAEGGGASTVEANVQKPTQKPKDNEFHCYLDESLKEIVESRFKVMDQLEIFHPTSDHIICSGRIRKVVFPLLWVQLSSDCYTLVPFNQTDIYPAGWCQSHGLKLVSLLPPRRQAGPETDGKGGGSRQRDAKRSRKKAKISNKSKKGASNSKNDDEIADPENFDLVNLEDRQAGIDYILKERSAYVKIYFNHKCFTGPSLSKSKICTLPQYVGPGPMRLVIEEVVTKLISVGYVPPRVLNELSSESFKELLIERNLTNTSPMEFKAKYQKRVHREKVPVCLNPEEVKLYCECVCEHIKCCYNLFGLNQFDGEFCPSNCRSLTKSNKFMKRATYYRDKARQGESPSIPANNISSGDNNNPRHSNKTSGTNGKRKAVDDLYDDDAESPDIDATMTSATVNNAANVVAPPLMETPTPEMDNDATTRARYNGRGSSNSTSSSNISRSDEEMDTETLQKVNEWTIEDVARYLEERKLGIFKTYMQAEGIDGQAFMLLDRPAIEEHFQLETKSEITQEDVNKLCDTVDLFKTFSKIY